MRISTLSKKMNSVKNSLLLCLSLFMFSSILVFSFSTNSYAMDYVTFPNSSYSSQVVTNAYPGCIYNDYNIGNNDITVHSSNSTYCSWWSSDVINTLTPVFVLVSNMILFGFIVSWLRGDRAYSIFKEDRSIS